MGVRGRVGDVAERFGEEVNRPPGRGRGAGGGPGVKCLHQLPQPVREFGCSVLSGEEQEGLDDGPDAVVRYGDGGRVLAVPWAAPVDQGVQRLVEVQVHALDPVGEFLVGEAVAGACGDEETLGEDGGRPAGAAAQAGRCGAPGEHGLEGGPVQLALSGSQTAAGGLVDLAGDLGGEAAYGGAAQAVLGGEADGDAEAHQVEVGGEDVVAVEAGGGGAVGKGGESCADLGEEAEGEGVAGVLGGEGGRGDGVAGPGLVGFSFGEVGEVEVAVARGVWWACGGFARAAPSGGPPSA